MTAGAITALLEGHWRQATHDMWLSRVFPAFFDTPSQPDKSPFRCDRIEGIYGIDGEYLLKRTSSIPDVEGHFNRVRAEGRCFDVDLRNFARLLIQARNENCQGFSFNIDLSTALDPHAAQAFSTAVRKAGFDSQRIILEITEHTPLPEKDDVSVLGHLKSAGFRLAADDVNFRDAGAVKRFLALKPYMDFAKIDHHGTAHLRQNGIDDAALSIFEGCQVIVEGIHQEDEGTEFLQGLKDRGFALQYYIQEHQENVVFRPAYVLPQPSYAQHACA